MIKVSELIDSLTESVSKDINVLDFYISIDDRDNVIRYRIPLKLKKDPEKEAENNERDDNSRL